MSLETSLFDIFDHPLEGIRNTGYNYLLEPLPEYITENLKYEPYYFQKEALQNFIFYMEAKENPKTALPFRDTDSPVHLMFNMATGSGKTLVMAAHLLYFINQGYKKFLFVSHQSNIVNKTKENLNNKYHQKYLFEENIFLNSQNIEIREVEQFSDTENIEIRFTTIHALHYELSEENISENTNDQEELNKLDLVILADEAHHFNVSTNRKRKKTQTTEDSNPIDIEHNWEDTLIEKVFNKSFEYNNNRNVLLEYTATVPENKDVEKKYIDKTIYKFGLKEFMHAKLTKEINLVSFTLNPKEKILYALAFNWMRHKTALKYKIPNFKPVILFRRKTIEESKEDYEYFFEVIENLKLEDLNFLNLNIPNESNSSSVHEQGIKRTEQLITLLSNKANRQEFLEYIKNNFKRELNVIITNSKTNKLKKERVDPDMEKLLNNLEDPNNNIRAIFTVKRLTEGWDVQNLYDIVRMDTSQNKGGSTKKIPAATIEEKQLIGRAVRFNPYKFDNQVVRNRQFDDDLDNELRLLEEFFYFTYDDEKGYISDLKSVLSDEGYIDTEKKLVNFQLKKSFINKPFYKSAQLWENMQISGSESEVFLKSIDQLDKTIELKLPKLSIVEEKLSEDLSSLGSKEIFSDENNVLMLGIKDFERHQIIKAIYKQKKSYTELINIFNIKSFDQLHTSSVLAYFKIRVLSKYDNFDSLTNLEKIKILELFFDKVINELTTLHQQKYGEKSFRPISLAKYFSAPKQKNIEVDAPQDARIFNKISKKPWYVVETVEKDSGKDIGFIYGSSEEKAFLKMFDEVFASNISKKFEEFYLLRNEEQFKLYNFKTGKGFMPDFLLFLKLNKDLIYVVLIEPKGSHLMQNDEEKSKEEFLESIDSLFGLNGKKLFKDNTGYSLIGLPFFNSDQSESFVSKFEKIIT